MWSSVRIFITDAAMVMMPSPILRRGYLEDRSITDDVQKTGEFE
jgi:hypothetical protein